MNMQAMLKEAQKLQKEMLNTQEKINSMEFIGKSSLVTITMNGKKEIVGVKISEEIVVVIGVCVSVFTVIGVFDKFSKENKSV